MPISVKVLLRDKYKLRTLMEKHSLLLHVMLRQGTSWYALDNIDYGGIRDLNLYFRMASKLSITQNFRQLTLTLPADLVMVDIDVKILKGQYTYSLNNNYTDLSFTP